jgi:predicted RNA-binding Zn-ribbon protein involved in translation (DUF1610 family)
MLEEAKVKQEPKSEYIRPANTPEGWPDPRIAMNCPDCGLRRLLPTALKLQDIFELCPCPKCGNAFKGRFVGNGVEEILG